MPNYPVTRVCTECGEQLGADAAPTKLTCSDNCRGKRSRRLKRSRKREVDPDIRDVHSETGRQILSVSREVMMDELRPIVREAITEDITRAIAGMVALTPRAIEVLGEHLDDEDTATQQRAAALVTKYTMGHPAFVRPEEDNSGKQVVVQFNLPRPDSVDGTAEVIIDDETKECDMCHTDKPLSQFVDGSNRCRQCFEDFQAAVRARFSTDDSV
jgi:hypothetical protein